MSEPLDPLDRATRILREPPAMDPAAKSRLLAALRQEPVPRVSLPRRAWRWLARPRTIVVSPIAGLAVAASLVLAVVLRPESDAPSGAASGAEVETAATASAAPPAATLVEAGSPVEFMFIAPMASSVSLVGDFNGWDPEATPLRLRNGVWVVQVPLTPGRHVYSFIVDGRQWYADPLAARAPEGGADAPSSVVLVGRSL